MFLRPVRLRACFILASSKAYEFIQKTIGHACGPGWSGMILKANPGLIVSSRPLQLPFKQDTCVKTPYAIGSGNIVSAYIQRKIP